MSIDNSGSTTAAMTDADILAILASLPPQQVQRRIQRAEQARRAALAAELRLAQQELSRFQNLFERRVISRSRLDRAEDAKGNGGLAAGLLRQTVFPRRVAFRRLPYATRDAADDATNHLSPI